MNGAREYAAMFKTGQHGKLYFVSGEHARGKTFKVFVLPKGEDAVPNGPQNGPLNQDAVEVFGIIGGNPGWTEYYGWLHTGPWQQDFDTIVEKRREEIEHDKKQVAEARASSEVENRRKITGLLEKY